MDYHKGEIRDYLKNLNLVPNKNWDLWRIFMMEWFRPSLLLTSLREVIINIKNKEGLKIQYQFWVKGRLCVTYSQTARETLTLLPDLLKVLPRASGSWSTVPAHPLLTLICMDVKKQIGKWIQLHSKLYQKPTGSYLTPITISQAML